MKIYVKHGMIVDKCNEIISFKQTKWMEENISFETQKRNKAENDSEKDSYNLPNNAIYGKTMKKVRKRLILEVIEN